MSLTFDLPLPPSLNEMIALAKKRTKRTRTGGWIKGRALPVVYDQHLEAYETEALAAIRRQGIVVPRTPWARWALVSAAFRAHSLRDWTELLASLKWPVDALVRLGFVANDSPREMAPPPTPTQAIDRAHRGVTLVIAPQSGEFPWGSSTCREEQAELARMGVQVQDGEPRGPSA